MSTQYAAWAAFGNAWTRGRVVRIAAKTVTVQDWRHLHWGFGDPLEQRKPLAGCVLFDNEADAAALVAAIADLNEREAETRRIHAETRTALIAAAREKEMTK